MANAIEKANSQAKVAERQDLIKRLKALDEDTVVSYVTTHKLPATTQKWTLEQLRDAVTAMENGHSGVAYLITYPEADKAQVSIARFASREEAEAQEVEEGVVSIVAESEEDLKAIDGETLLNIFNVGKSTKAKKLAPGAANRVVWESLAAGAETTTNGNQKAANKKAKAEKQEKAKKEPAPPKRIAYEPREAKEIKQVRAGTKVAQLIDLLNDPKGTTIEDIERELSKVGKPINGRSWIGYDLNKVCGYGCREDESGRLFIVLPKGMKAPLDHKTAEEKKPQAPKAPKGKKAEQVTGAEEGEAETTPAPKAAKKATGKKPTAAQKEVQEAAAGGK